MLEHVEIAISRGDFKTAIDKFRQLAQTRPRYISGQEMFDIVTSAPELEYALSGDDVWGPWIQVRYPFLYGELNEDDDLKGTLARAFDQAYSNEFQWGTYMKVYVFYKNVVTNPTFFRLPDNVPVMTMSVRWRQCFCQGHYLMLIDMKNVLSVYNLVLRKRLVNTKLPGAARFVNYKHGHIFVSYDDGSAMTMHMDDMDVFQIDKGYWLDPNDDDTMLLCDIDRVSRWKLDGVEIRRDPRVYARELHNVFFPDGTTDMIPTLRHVVAPQSYDLVIADDRVFEKLEDTWVENADVVDMPLFTRKDGACPISSQTPIFYHETTESHRYYHDGAYHYVSTLLEEPVEDEITRTVFLSPRFVIHVEKDNFKVLDRWAV